MTLRYNVIMIANQFVVINKSDSSFSSYLVFTKVTVIVLVFEVINLKGTSVAVFILLFNSSYGTFIGKMETYMNAFQFFIFWE